MSYDLMVFEEKNAPRTKEEFMKWYDEQTQWKEDHDYSDVNVCSTGLQKFYNLLKEEYIFADDDMDEIDVEDEENKYIDHCAFGREIIYLCFPRGASDYAYEDMLDFAMESKVGFFDVSGCSEVVFSDGSYIRDLDCE